jgi:hypothetical protein
MTAEFEQLLREKVALEQYIQSAIEIFELSYSHAIEVESIDIDRMRLIGPHKALIKIELKVR